MSRGWRWLEKPEVSGNGWGSRRLVRHPAPRVAMPDGSGLDALAELRDLPEPTRAALLTAAIEGPDIAACNSGRGVSC